MKDRNNDLLVHIANLTAHSRQNVSNLLEEVNTSSDLASFSPSRIAQYEPIMSLLWPSQPTPSFTPSNRSQRVHESDSSLNFHRYIHLWHSPSKIMTQFNESDIQNTLALFAHENYMIFRKKRMQSDKKRHQREGLSSTEEDIYLCVSRNCSSTDQLKAIFEAYVNSQVENVKIARYSMSQLFPVFLDVLIRSNWNVISTQLRKKGSLVYDKVYSHDHKK
jgi:hypothetical protein